MSWQARIIKKLIPLQVSRWAGGSIQMQRARQERTARFSPLPAGTRNRPVTAGGVPAEWIEAPNAGPGVILYLHGGGYTVGSINTHRELVARLARASGLRGLVVAYRLAPEHPYSAALEDTCSAYRWLLAAGINSSQIFLAGDSAGGGLALAALVSLRDTGAPLPAGGICISPWTDLAGTGLSMRSNAKIECILNPNSLAQWAACYAGQHDPKMPLISPLYADLRGLPPLLIQAGTSEILLDDATRIAKRAGDAGVAVTLEIWDEMFHVFQMVPILPETKRAVKSIAEFVSKHLKSPQ